jgi:hypothetical protein
MSDQRFFNHRDNPRKTDEPQTLTVGDPLRKQGNEQRGSDPYNTSGSFDRKKNWARVGKR